MTSAAIEREFSTKVLGSILVLTGILVLLCGGGSDNRQETVLNGASFHTAAAVQHRDPLSPIVGELALTGGPTPLMAPRRQQD